MLTIEEYIARRKKEDRLNEFDVDMQPENMKNCVNYVFEYFNNYLNITEAEEKTVLHNEKLDKLRKQFEDYDPEVREWLVSISSEYGKQVNRYVGNLLKDDEFFLLYNSDSEFRSLSYDCYSKLIKKLPFLKDQTEMLFLFLKDFHRIKNQQSRAFDIPFISEEINEWVEDTWNKYQISVTGFASNWASYFYDKDSLYPPTHRKKSEYSWRKYDYDYKQKSNLFNIDSLYRKMPKKPYTKNRKQEFEILIMYYWLNSIYGDESGYWDEYLNKVLYSLSQE